MTQQTNNDQEEPTTPQSEIVTIEGGVELEIKYKNGSKETVKIRQIPATKISDFAQRLGDEAFSVSIYCDKPMEWVDSLSYDSLNAIAEKGMEINLPFLNGWFHRRAKWNEATAVGAIAELKRKVETMMEVLQSGNFAPRSPTTTDSLLRR
jgi:hypothetical protein